MLQIGSKWGRLSAMDENKLSRNSVFACGTVQWTLANLNAINLSPSHNSLMVFTSVCEAQLVANSLPLECVHISKTSVGVSPEIFRLNEGLFLRNSLQKESKGSCLNCPLAQRPPSLLIGVSTNSPRDTVHDISSSCNLFKGEFCASYFPSKDL